MPGFVKTPEDEKVWARAKHAAGIQGKGTDMTYARANMIFHKMKGSERTERHGNPGTPKVVPQYPHTRPPEGAPFPFNKLERVWQEHSWDCQTYAAKYYDHGERRLIERQVPVGPGGDGGVIHTLSESSLAKGRKK